MKFAVPWRNLPAPGGSEERVPVLDVYLRSPRGQEVREIFLIDSGADISMAPRRLAELLGLNWSTGTLIEMQGIAQRDECKVVAAIHFVEIFIRQTARRLTIPVCFAEGDALTLLGREGFFDAFRIQFDKANYLTTFEPLLSKNGNS